MSSAIRTSDLSHSFSGREVLHSVSFTVRKGDFFVILGPNGSGKTTLMKLIAGIHKPQNGQIEILGRSNVGYPARELARAVAFVPQRLPVDLPFSVRETVLLGRAPYQGVLGIESETDSEIAGQALRFTDMAHLSNSNLRQLSGGEQQRVFIARAICQQAEIMLLDEPTAALDLAHQVKVMDLMEKLKIEKGITVIMVSHDVNLASMYADQVLLLKSGEIVTLGDPHKVISLRNLEPAYGCRLRVDESPVGGYPRITVVPEKHRNTE